MKRQELFEKWIDALESGKYKQGKEFLLQGVNGKEKYCCLGVLCDVYNQSASHKITFEDLQVLPMEVYKHMKMDDLGEFIVDIKHNGKRAQSLAELNDNGARFKTIAKIIRKQLEEQNFVEG